MTSLGEKMHKRKLSIVFMGLFIFNTTAFSTKRTADTQENDTTRGKVLKEKKAAVDHAISYADPADIVLKQGKGTKDHGGGEGGFYWRILYQQKPAGRAFINLIDEEPIGEHPSLQIFLNKKSQGKHIGRHVYRKACELSSYDKVYAHMSKSNIASRKAAEVAGFEVFSTVKQLVLRWVRK
jgi:hypothetical protein